MKIDSTKTGGDKSEFGHWTTYTIIFLSLAIIGVLGAIVWVFTSFPDGVRGGSTHTIIDIFGSDSFNVLVAGLDKGDLKSSRSDSVLVARISLNDKSVGILSIPRDSRINIPEIGPNKLNHAYAVGQEQLLRKTVEEFINAPIEYYFIARLEGFVKLIDIVGGLDINVEKNMYYRDRAQGLFINFKKGLQHMDGEEVMEYARFRHDAEGDFGRIRRQQKVIKLLAQKALSIENIGNIPQFVRELLNENLISTNLSPPAALYLKKIFSKDFNGDIRAFMLHGTPKTIRGVSYVLPDMAELPYIVEGVLKNGYNPNHSLVKLRVLNACGSYKLASDFARRLEYFGFNVLNVKNLGNENYDTSAVVVKRNTPFGREIANILGANYSVDLDDTAEAHIDVIIGKDKLLEEKIAISERGE